MKQSLDLRLGQHLTITPQLQQAIRLLQLSSIELQQEIQEALESNPLLEEKEEESTEVARADAEAEGGNEAPAETAEESPGETAETGFESEPSREGETVSSGSDSGESTYEAEADMKPTDDMERTALEDSPGEPEWDENFDLPMTSSSSRSNDEDLPDIDARNSLPLTLRDHLSWQMQMTPFSESDRRIAESLIDAINEDGYLTSTLEDLHQSLGGDPDTGPEEIEAVLHQIQNFDPVGVGARNLAECLTLQLKALPTDTPRLKEAMALATLDNLPLLGSRDYNALRRNLKLTPEALQETIDLVQHLNPRPGGKVQTSQAAYIVPDIIVKKIKGVWRAELNPDIAPRLRVNRHYERMIHRGDSSTGNRYLQDQLQQARWFIKSLNSRNDTLLKVARTIVDRQRAFFDHGPEAMKPLVLHDIAETVNMHESTISRVTTNKYMLTPRGIFELKYFFSSHVATADGGACSATAIRSMIKKLVENEPPLKPISDSTIAEILAKQGINVARRTIAKYRESMSIPPSSQRKSLVSPSEKKPCKSP
jgi:RNA polymerase sigma-54 factor